MASSKYAPGDWFAVMRSGTVVILAPDTPQDIVSSVWALLESAPEAQEVLHEVTEAFGVSLSRIPPFGIIDSKEELRVFLRGGLELAVQLGRGAEKLSGRDVTTWTERWLPAPRSYILDISAASGGGSASTAVLPVEEAVVMLSALSVSLDGSSPDGVRPAGGIFAGEIFAGEKDGQAPVPPASVPTISVSPDAESLGETMMDFHEGELGLTIAPGQAPVADQDLPGDGNGEETAVQDDEGQDGEGQDGEGQGTLAAASDDAGAASGEPLPGGLTGTTDPLVYENENTTSYDHLWERTVVRRIEDAAVRAEAEEEIHDAGQPAAEAPDAPEAEEAPDALPAPAEPGAVVPSAGLIDSVPWKSAPASPALPDNRLFLDGQPPVGSAVPARQEPAPPLPPARLPPGPVIPSAVYGAPTDDSDHDGQTIMKSELDPDSGEAPPRGHEAAVAGNGPAVLARVCLHGHASPPTYSQCSACGLLLTGDAVQVPRPRLGRMRLSTGEVIDLEQSIIIGRQPSVSRVQGGAMPRLVQVDSPGGDISRSHVEVRLEGWHVMLCDLKATNGTVLVREGQAPRRLAQSEMAILLDGDIAELGDNISLRFEEIL